MTIHVLSEIVAAQIAAGEVVERPASVVKELVENALDAGATVVQVESEGGGRGLIRVSDNGGGIPAAEVELAFVRHATSKLQTVEDLYQIQTLGFRGEALASIASVSQMSVLTRAANETAGTLMRVRGGVTQEKRQAGTPVGTVFTVESLFYNTPARLKFLKAETTERRHIDGIITRYATAYPGVRFTLKQDGRLVFQTTGNGSLADVLVETLGLEIMREMIEVTPTERRRADLPAIDVSGYTSAPHLNRNTRSHIQLFVNGRAIQDSSLAYAVTQAYHTLMPSDRYPLAVLLIQLPPEEVDVNVHPTKAEVRFRSADAVFSAVQTAVRRAVAQHAPVPNATGALFDDTPRPDPTPTYTPTFPPSLRGDSRRASYGSQTSYSDDVRESGLRPRQLRENEPALEDDESPEPPLANSLREPVPATPNRAVTAPPPYATGANVRKLPPMRVVGQVAATYIIAEGPAGMYLIDQHAAHERILFEQFMTAQAAQQRNSQRTLGGIDLEVTPASAALIAEHLDGLTALGFEIEPTGKRTVRVNAVPDILATRSPEGVLHLILDDLEDGAEPGAASIEAKVLMRVCKAAAVKAGQVLSYAEMQQMIRMLEQCQNPRSCPHGRPTLIHLSADQLAKEFGRM